MLNLIALIFCSLVTCFAPVRVMGDEGDSASSGSGRFTFDIGASTGKVGSETYTEANLGLNYYAESWLAWRNALFGRFQTAQQNVYGLDTSLRAIAEFGDYQTGLTAFIGPGYRFASGIDSSPFAEEGLVFHLGGLSVGGGAKQVFNSLAHPNHVDDTQYFLILAGGGSL